MHDTSNQEHPAETGRERVRQVEKTERHFRQYRRGIGLCHALHDELPTVVPDDLIPKDPAVAHAEFACRLDEVASLESFDQFANAAGGLG